jgi:hypothetical protein
MDSQNKEIESTIIKNKVEHPNIHFQESNDKSDLDSESDSFDEINLNETNLGKRKLPLLTHNNNYKDKIKKNWHKDITLNLRDYGYQSAGYSWMHDRDATFYNGLNNKLELIAAILSTITTAGIALVIPLVENEIIWLMYTLLGVSIALSLSAAIINVIKIVKNYNFKISEHSEKSAKFSKLYRKVKNQFSLKPTRRYDAQTFLEYTTDRFNELDREKPFIRDSTIKKWKDQQILNEQGDPLYGKLLPLPSEIMQEINDDTTIQIDNNCIKSNNSKSVNNWIKTML